MAHRAKSIAHPQITQVGFSEPTGQAQIFADLRIRIRYRVGSRKRVNGYLPQ